MYYDVIIVCFFIYCRFQNSYEMNRIKEVLEEKGIKQVWLAEKLGKSFNTVNGYVQNRAQPSLEVLYEIGRILNVHPRELIGNEEVNG